MEGVRRYNRGYCIKEGESLNSPNREAAAPNAVVLSTHTRTAEVQAVPAASGVQRRRPVDSERTSIVERRTATVASSGEENID